MTDYPCGPLVTWLRLALLELLHVEPGGVQAQGPALGVPGGRVLLAGGRSGGRGLVSRDGGQLQHNYSEILNYQCTESISPALVAHQTTHIKCRSPKASRP